MGKKLQDKLFLAITLFSLCAILSVVYNQFHSAFEEYRIKAVSAERKAEKLATLMVQLKKDLQVGKKGVPQDMAAGIPTFAMARFFELGRTVLERKAVKEGIVYTISFYLRNWGPLKAKAIGKLLSEGLSEIKLSGCPQEFVTKVKELVKLYRELKFNEAQGVWKELRAIQKKYLKPLVHAGYVPAKPENSDIKEVLKNFTGKLYFNSKAAEISYNPNSWVPVDFKGKSALKRRRTSSLVCIYGMKISLAAGMKDWSKVKKSIIMKCKRSSYTGSCQEENINGHMVLTNVQKIQNNLAITSSMFIPDENGFYAITFNAFGENREKYLVAAKNIFRTFRILKPGQKKALSLPVSENSEPDNGSYTIDNHSAQMTYDIAKWEKKISGRAAMLKYRAHGEALLIVGMSLAHNIPWKRGTHELINHFKEKSTDGKVTREELGKNLILTYDFRQQNTILRNSMMFVPVGNKCYGFYYTGPVDLHKKHKAEAHKIFKTLEILKPVKKNRDKILAGGPDGQAKLVTSIMKVCDRTLSYPFFTTWPTAPIYRAENPHHYLVEYIPADQKLANWKDMFTIQGFKGFVTKGIDHITFAKFAEQAERKSSGDNLLFKTLFSGDVNGTPAIIYLMGTRDRLDGTGEVGMHIVFKGDKDLCMVHRSWIRNRYVADNLPISEHEQKHWLKVLKAIKWK